MKSVSVCVQNAPDQPRTESSVALCVGGEAGLTAGLGAEQEGLVHWAVVSMGLGTQQEAVAPSVTFISSSNTLLPPLQTCIAVCCAALFDV